ncbi:unnamed protein product [Symbiodinium sp. CCMP2592]|nr:unnamed protein product [Symbiodinium sp. CCMP2592]
MGASASLNTFRGKRFGSEASLKLLGPFTLRFPPTMEALADAFSWLTSSWLCDMHRPEGYAREPEFVIQSVSMPSEVMTQLSPFLSVQSLAPLRATCRQPASTGEEAFQQLLKLPAKRRHQIHRVENIRSAEQWAKLTKGKEDCKWHIASKRRFMCDISGEWVLYTPTGSMFDGLKEYLLFTQFLPAEPLPSKTEDILFGKSSK